MKINKFTLYQEACDKLSSRYESGIVDPCQSAWDFIFGTQELEKALKKFQGDTQKYLQNYLHKSIYYYHLKMLRNHYRNREQRMPEDIAKIADNSDKENKEKELNRKARRRKLKCLKMMKLL